MQYHVLWVVLLSITKDNPIPYVGLNLQGFNRSTNTSWCYDELLVTFREEKYWKTIKTKFLVIDYQPIYTCIINRSTMVEFGSISSTVYMKLKYHMKFREVAIYASF